MRRAILVLIAILITLPVYAIDRNLRMKGIDALKNDFTDICMKDCTTQKSSAYCKELCSSYTLCWNKCKLIKERGYCEKACKFDLKWKFLGLDFEEAPGAWFYASEIIASVSKGRVKVWAKYIYTKSEIEGMIESFSSRIPKIKELDYELILFEFDCTQKKFRVLEITEYASDGSVIDDNKFPEADWEKLSHLVPQSAKIALYKEVCQQSLRKAKP